MSLPREEHATRGFEREAPELEPAPAATVVLVRDGTEGLETLLIQRGSTLRVGAGMWVFPGGRVEAADHDRAGDGPRAAGSDAVVAAAARAAAREAREEVGLHLRDGDLVLFSHWLTPPVVPVRFATWFFMAAAPEGEVVVDGSETTDHVWIRPEDALARRDRHELRLMPPTWVTLHDLAPLPTVADALADAGSREPRWYTTLPVTVDDERVALFPGDAGFHDGDPALSGPRHRLHMGRERWSFERTVTTGATRTIEPSAEAPE